MVRRSFALFLVLLLVGTFTTGSTWIEDAALGDEATSPAVGKSDPKAESDKPQRQRDDEEYYELLRLFADTLDQVDRNYVREISRRELMEAAIEGVLSKLDQYSNYIPPKDYERFRSGIESEFGGIGIQVSIENGKLKIISPLVGTPAYRAGLMSGDRIIKIEGENTKGITLDGAVQKLKGKVGTEVTFTVLHPHNGSTETVTVKRETVRVDTVMGDSRNEDDSWNYLLGDEKGIGYIRISAFSRHTPAELRAAMQKLKKQDLRGLIIDLRFNPGGLLSAAIQVSDMFVSKGVIVSTKGRNTPELVRRAHKAGTYQGFPIAIMVNHYSASASEIVSACLQDHKRAVVIGQRTWGKGSVQNIINLEKGRSALKLTTASYHRPSGKNIHRFEGATEKDDWGVMPDDGYRIKLSDAETGRFLAYRRHRDIIHSKNETDPAGGDEAAANFDDRQLKKALAYLAEKLGDEDPRTKAPNPPQPTTSQPDEQAAQKD